MVFDEAILALPMVNRNAELLAVLVPGLELALPKTDPARMLALATSENLLDRLFQETSELTCLDREE